MAQNTSAPATLIQVSSVVGLCPKTLQDLIDILTSVLGVSGAAVIPGPVQTTGLAQAEQATAIANEVKAALAAYQLVVNPNLHPVSFITPPVAFPAAAGNHVVQFNWSPALPSANNILIPMVLSPSGALSATYAPTWGITQGSMTQTSCEVQWIGLPASSTYTAMIINSDAPTV